MWLLKECEVTPSAEVFRRRWEYIERLAEMLDADSWAAKDAYLEGDSALTSESPETAIVWFAKPDLSNKKLDYLLRVQEHLHLRIAAGENTAGYALHAGAQIFERVQLTGGICLDRGFCHLQLSEGTN